MCNITQLENNNGIKYSIASHLFQYGKTAKFYVYAPGELDLNVLIGRCKEMPRKRDPEGKPQKFKMLPSQQMQQEAYSHASPPKGTERTI